MKHKSNDGNDPVSLEDAILGETQTPFKISTPAEVQLAALLLARQSRRCLKIFSHDLEEMIYNNEAFVKSVVKIVKWHRSTFVQILVQDPVPALKCGHLLIEESQRLSSQIQIRRTDKDFRDKTKCYLLADDVGLLVRNHWNSYEGTVKFHAGGDAIKYHRLFSNAWETGVPEVEFRRLGL